MANSISSFQQFHHCHKLCVSVAVRSLLPNLTYPMWYTRFQRYSYYVEVPLSFILIILSTRSEVLTQQISYNHSVALSSMSVVAFMHLSVVLLVNKFHYWFGCKVKINIALQNLLLLYKINDSVMKIFSVMLKRYYHVIKLFLSLYLVSIYYSCICIDVCAYVYHKSAHTWSCIRIFVFPCYLVLIITVYLF